MGHLLLVCYIYASKADSILHYFYNKDLQVPQDHFMSATIRDP